MSVVEPVVVPDALRPSQRGLAVPPTARRAVVRSALVARLCSAVHASMATIVAPAGYGKTTLLAQWADRDAREVLGVAFEPEDDDPDAVELLLRPIAEEPGLLALLDDVHVIRSPEAVDALARLLDHAPAGTTVALAGRSLPPLSLARVRAEGRLIEIATENLALTSREAESLLRLAKAPLSPAAAAGLGDRLEGWPAAIYLAALSLREGTPVETLDGDDCFLADYLEAEYLVGLSKVQRRFAMDTAMLDELTPERCDSLLERHSSDAMLASLQRAGVAAVDRHRRRYRYPRIVREHLLAELKRSEPERARTLHRAVAAHAAECGAVEEAVAHAAAAGDLDHTAELAGLLAVPACGRGRFDALEPWLGLLRNEPIVDRQPDLCVAAAWLYAVRGRPGEARHWADVASRGLGADDPRLRLLRGLQCRAGVSQMLDDTTAACDALPAGDAWQPFATLAHGVALLLAGDVAGSEQTLVEAVELATAAGASELKILALCLLTLVSIAEGVQADADAFAVEEAAAVEEGETPSGSLVALLVHATRARTAARHGDLAAAEASLQAADELLGCATPAVPWLATLALLELAHVRLAVADAGGARLLLRRVSDIFRVRPGLGVLTEQVAELDRQTQALSEPTGRWASSLTPAERRLLPFLATHLSFREIGTHLYVSRNTVKTQAIAVYRKFGVTSRSAAIARAIDLGLIDDHTHATGAPFRGAE